MQRVKSFATMVRRGAGKHGPHQDAETSSDDAGSAGSSLTTCSPLGPAVEAACCAAVPMSWEPSSHNGAGGANTTTAAPAAACWLLGDRYTYQSLLNRGGQGSVVRAVVNATGETVAVKLVPRSRVSVSGVTRELVHHSRLQGHPHIIGMREAYLTNDHLCVVMDFADGGDLAEHLSRHVYQTNGGFTEDAARRIFQQLVSALDWMHRAGIASRDIKCDNVLLSGPEATVKLADFGWSCTEQAAAKYGDRLCGTPEYMSPEVLRRAVDAGSQPSDVWAAGVLLWTLISGGFPFLRPEEEALGRTDRIRAMAPRIVLGCTRPLPDEASPQLADLLRKMLKVDPRNRITIGEVARHPWVTHNLPRQLVLLNEMLEVARLRAQAAAQTAAAAAAAAAAATAAAVTKPVEIHRLPVSAFASSAGGGGLSRSHGSSTGQLPHATAAAAAVAAAGRPLCRSGSSGGCGGSRCSSPGCNIRRSLSDPVSAPLSFFIRQSNNDLRALVQKAAGYSAADYRSC